MSSGCVWFSVPISSAGPHLPQFLYFSAASRRSWRVSLRAGMAFPRVGVGGENRRGATLSHGRFPVEKAWGMPAVDCLDRLTELCRLVPYTGPSGAPALPTRGRTVMTKGIQTHKVFKLGKASAKRDKRNLLFATLVRKAALPK